MCDEQSASRVAVCIEQMIVSVGKRVSQRESVCEKETESQRVSVREQTTPTPTSTVTPTNASILASMRGIDMSILFCLPASGLAGTRVVCACVKVV